MGKIENKEEEEKIREYLMAYIKYYATAREKIGIPLDEEQLKNLIKEIQIELHEDDKTTGTFEVSQKEKFFRVVRNNFKKNGNKRNNFLMLHEMTHLSSKYNKELYTMINDKMREFNEMKCISENENISGWDVVYGLIAIEETLAQWCGEECNDAMNETKREKKKEEHRVLGTTVVATTDFSDKDVYAPLQQYVEGFAKSVGFRSLSEFARAMITGEQSLFDKINEGNAEVLGYIGILCEGIYQENGFGDCGLPETDIPIAIKYLDSKLNTNGFPDAPTGNGDAR